MQAAAQVGGLADIGFGLGIVAAEEEDGRRGWGGGEGFRVAIGVELEALGSALGHSSWNATTDLHGEICSDTDLHL